jgi:hypothetical protein
VRIEDLTDGQLDICREPGLKIWAFAGHPGGPAATDSGDVQPAAIQVVIHHVALDGLGGLQILLDWLGIYQRLQQAQSIPPLLEVQELPLPRRCQPPGGVWQTLRLLPGQWKSVRASWQLLGRRAIPLGAGPAASGSMPRRPAVARLQLDQATTEQLKRAAAAQSATLNSLLIRDLLQTIEDWQQQLPQAPAGTHLRIMIPIDQRRREHRHSAACNHCSMVHVDRTRDEVRDPVQLLAGIEQEMGVIQRWNLSLNFWRALALFRWLPGGLERFQSSEVAATASLTNLGRLRLTAAWATHEVDPPSSPHPLRLRDFEIVAPLLHGTMGAFAAAYWQGRLKLTLNYDPHHLTAAEADQLMARYHKKLQGNLSS